MDTIDREPADRRKRTPAPLSPRRASLFLSAALLAISGLAFPDGVRAEPGEAVPGRLILMFQPRVADRIDDVLEGRAGLTEACGGDASLEEAFERIGVTELKRLFPDVDRVIRERGFLTPREAYETYQQRIRERFPARTARAPAGSKHIPTYGIFTVRFDPAHAVGAACHAIQETGQVVYAEPDRIVTLDYTPNDPYFSSDLWGLKKIDCPAAWDTASGSGVVVAVIDSGVDLDHPDLQNRLWTNPGETAGNSSDDDSNGYVDDVNGWDFVHNDNDPDDDNGHGSHCAGTVAAEENNGTGVVGVAFSARIMCLKGMGSGGSGNDTDLDNCLNYAINNGAHVMSNSWGGHGYSNTYAVTVSNAVSSGVVPVFAAGNDNQCGSMHSPSNCPSAFSVAAMNISDGRASFSNYGIKIDVTAPGRDIRSTVPGGGYAVYSGTSMATPHVSGVVAVMLSDLAARSQNATVEQVRQMLRAYCDDTEAPGWDRREGHGRVNVNNMMGADAARVCEAKINAPDAATPVTGSSVDVQGYAWAPSGAFQDYTLEYAPETPRDTDPWTTITTSTNPVQNASLHNWDVSGLADGRYTLRLTARNTQNEIFRDRIEFVRDTYADDASSNAVEVKGNPLTYHVLVDRNFTTDDEDWLVMECVGGVDYVFRTDRLSGKTDTVIDLYQSDASTLEGTNDDYPSDGEKESRIAWSCGSSGTYYLKVYGWKDAGAGYPHAAPGSYRLHLIGLFKDGFEPDAAVAQAGTLAANGPAAHHSIVPAGDVDWMQFPAEAGKTYVMEVSKADASAAMNLDLYDATGTTLLASGSAGSDGRVRITGWTCPTGGTYTLRASAGAGATGHYLARVYEKEDVLFVEDFETVGDELWTPSNGTWSVSGGAYRQGNNADSAHFSSAGLDGWSDAVVEGTLRFQNSSASHGNSGLILRWIDADSYIVARVRETNPGFDITQWENGTAERLAGLNASLSAGTDYPVRITFEGPYLTFEVSGEVAIQAYSPRFTSGRLALRSYGAVSFFDDLKIWKPGPGTVGDLAFTPPLLPDGMEGAFYSTILEASGGQTPYTFAHLGGTLPPGMSVAADGTLSGTPTAAGNYTFSVTVTDPGDRLRAGQVTLNIVAATTGDTTPPAVTFVNPSDGQEVPADAETLQVDVTDPSAVKRVRARVRSGSWYDLTFMGSDRYEGPLDLAEGPNLIEVEAEDYASNSGTTPITVHLDTTPPVLTFGTYKDNAAVHTPSIVLDGTGLDAATVTVDGNPADTFDAVSGAWTETVSLAYGENVFVVRATDSFSRVDERTLHIHFRLKGDVDNDGDVDHDDALLVAQYEAGTASLCDADANFADVDLNGLVNIQDAYAIRRVADGKMVFP